MSMPHNSMVAVWLRHFILVCGHFLLRSIVAGFPLAWLRAPPLRLLRLWGRLDSCASYFDSKASISSTSKGRLAKPFDKSKLFEALRTAQ
jgi:hypothetical protein